MDLTNRVLIIGGALLWIFVLLLIILLAWGAPDQSIDRLGDLAGYLEDHNNTSAKLLITFGALILALLAVAIIIFEVAPPETGTLKVERVGAGEARISTDEIALRVEEEVRSVPHVAQVQATVLGRGLKAEISLDLHVGEEADLTATAEEACRRTRQLVEERMGVALTGPPKAELHYRELHVARDRPAPEVTAMPTPEPAPQERQASGFTGWERLPPQAPAQQGTPGPFTPPTSTAEPAREASETPPTDRPAGA
jgi:hypothetical protein